MRLDALTGAIATDRRRGRRPLFVVASAGSTNTGSIDPLAAIAAVCAQEGAWLHVDAAYGGFAALTDRGKRWLNGIQLADSITLDPHKWLYQPYECGSLLVREGERLRADVVINLLGALTFALSVRVVSALELDQSAVTFKLPEQIEWKDPLGVSGAKTGAQR